MNLILKNILKKRLLSVFRILGLTLGFGVAMYIVALNTYEKSYDTHWKNHSRLYRVGHKQIRNGEVVTHSSRNFVGAPALMKAEIPGVEAAVGFNKDVISVFCNNRQFNDVDWLWSDSSFFTVFSQNIIFQENEKLFGNLHGVAISESFAKKLYGKTNVLYQRFKLNEGWEFYVSAVFEDIPQNSHFTADVVGCRKSLFYYMQNFDNASRTLNNNPAFSYHGVNPYGTWPWNTPSQYQRWSYIRLGNHVDLRDVKIQMDLAMTKVNLPPFLRESDIDFIFQPITSIHLNSNLEAEISTNGSAKRVLFLYIIAGVVLLVCAINFINLSHISAIENGRQFAIRLINGAMSTNVFRALLFENLLISLVSGVCSLCIILFIPGLNIPLHVVITHFIGGLLVLSIMLSLVATLLPYFVSLKGKFDNYLKSKSGGGNIKGRQVLVVTQFAIAVVLISGTILIHRQVKFMQKSNLGFSAHQTMYSLSPVSMNMSPEIPSRLNTFHNRVLSIPGVKQFAVASSIPGKKIERGTTEITIKNNTELKDTYFDLVSVSNTYLDMFKINLIAGRQFRTEPDWQSNDVMVNKLGAKALGFKTPHDAIGKSVKVHNQDKTIVAVFNNYHHRSLHNKIVPIMLSQNLEWDHSVGYYAIRFDPKRTQQVLKEVSNLWEEIYPLEEARLQFTNASFIKQYQSEQQFNRILMAGSVMAVIISCLGLFAIARFNTDKRIREIGVRKVNGATVAEVLLTLNREFMVWVLIAILLALPLAYIASEQWLSSFAYKTNLSWWIFALSGILALGIATITVTWQSFKAATRNPVNALRYE